MTAATCCAIIAALMILQTKYYAPLTALLVFIILFSYQTSVGVYINSLLFIIFINYLKNGWNNQNKIYTKAAISISIFLILCVIYKIIYPYLFTQYSTRSVMSIYNVKNNILQIIFYIKLLFFNVHYIFYITVLTTIISLVIVQFKLFKNNQQKLSKSIFNIFIVGFLFIIFLLTSEGPSIFLQPYESDLRIFISISFLWLLSFYIISLFSKTIYYIFYTFFCFFCFSFSYSYGEFLREQHNFFTMIMTNINYDISHSNYTPSTQIIVINTFPLSKSNEKLTTRIPFFYIYMENKNFIG